MNYVSNETIAILKQRTFQLFLDKAQSRDVDQRIANLVLDFNNLPNIATIFSCSGHTIEEQKSKYEESKQRYEENHRYDPAFASAPFTPRLIEKAHLIFAIAEDGKDLVECFGDWLDTLTVTEWANARPNLSIRRLKVPMDVVQVINNDFHNCWKLECSFNAVTNDPNTGVQYLRNFYDYYVKNVLQRDTNFEQTEQKGSVSLATNEREGVPYVVFSKVMSFTRQHFDQQLAHRYWLDDQYLNLDTLGNILSNIRLMDQKQVNGTLVEIRSKHNQGVYLAIIHEGIEVVYSFKDTTFNYCITPTTHMAKNLLKILQNKFI